MVKFAIAALLAALAAASNAVADGVQLLDFSSPQCGPCRSMAPVFEEAAATIEPAARFAKLNTDEAQQVATRYGIRSIPTLMVFRDGREVARQAGAMDPASLRRWLSSALAA